MNIISSDILKKYALKKVTWSCALCGAGFGWAPRGTFAPGHEMRVDTMDRYTADRAPYVTTLADGKEYGCCSQDCVRTKALLVGLESIMRPPDCSQCQKSKGQCPFGRDCRVKSCSDYES